MFSFNPLGISVSLTDKGKNCKRLLQRHVVFYEENFSSKIKNIDSSFSKLVYNFHSAYQEREIRPSMKREKSSDPMRVKPDSGAVQKHFNTVDNFDGPKKGSLPILSPRFNPSEIKLAATLFVSRSISEKVNFFCLISSYFRRNIGRVA